jgi:hypothetical protein
MRVIIFISICLFSCYSIKGQELLIGDATVVKAIKAKTSKIYNNKDQTYFLLTKKQLRSTKTYGINIIAHSKNDTINRIIAISFTKKGQLSTEWYFVKNKLIHAYESFEYFKERGKNSSWKNFKGLNAWESRYYFVNEEIKYQKHKGRKKQKLNSKINHVLKDGRAIINYVIQEKVLNNKN